MTKEELDSAQIDLQNRMQERAKALGYEPDVSEPIYDGVGDVEAYLLSSPRIMWIMKEPHDRSENGIPTGGGWEVYDFTLAYPMWRTLMRITYGIRNRVHYAEIPEPDENMRKLLKATAYINLNKMPAHTTSNNTQLAANMTDWKDIVMEQVSTYRPDVIIFGNTFNQFEEGEFGEVQSGSDNDWSQEASLPGVTAVYKTKDNLILIDAYHPSGMRKCGRPDITDEVYIDTIIDGVLKSL